MVFAVTVSGIVVLACVLLVAAAFAVAFVAYERRSRAPSREEKFLDGLRRVESRVRKTTG